MNASYSHLIATMSLVAAAVLSPLPCRPIRCRVAID